MSKYLFLYREKNSDDRDCCAYIEDNQPRWECNHYFGNLTLHGACYCGHKFLAYEDIETVLTKEEYETLIAYGNTINELGYGIKKGDARYQRGLNAYADVKYVFDKLHSNEAKEFQEKIIASEIEYMKDEYGIDDDDIEKIFNEYYLDYRDRGIIGYVWRDIDEVAEEEAEQMGYVDPRQYNSSRYFNYEKFGEDLLESENYLELNDGRIVSLNY